jgi:hypothetical protein
LVSLGWLLIDRKSKSDLKGGGGGLYVIRHNEPNDKQAAILLAWCDLPGVRVKQMAL